VIKIYVNQQCCWEGNKDIQFISKLGSVDIKNVWNDNKYSPSIKRKMPLVSKNGGSLIPIKAFIAESKRSGELLAKDGDDEIHLIDGRVV